jgi:exodeoxyribonuclease V beta subunit
MSQDDVVETFDVCGPLPQGTVVLEASAGTGKTTTIASLTARYIAEGRATMPQLMLITYGRAATAELRSRVRERLVEVERALHAGSGEIDDPVVAILCEVDATERALRLQRLRSALAQFDDATIVTTHGFCQRVRTVLGSVGDLDLDARLEPDAHDVHRQVIEDFYVAKYAPTTVHDFPMSELREIATAALDDPAAALRPVDAPEPTATRVRMAQRARIEVARRKRLSRVIDYNDLLVQLSDALHHPDLGALAAERIRGPYQVVMVDEFQDTDPVQWDILRTTFAGVRTLILIGDPKQAIYAFRGGDVSTYLAAVRDATRQTLPHNWRTDAPVLAGLDQLLRGAALGHPEIAVRPVRAMRTEHQLTGAPPVVLRSLTRQVGGGSADKLPPIGTVRQVVYRDVAEQVVQRLTATTIRTPVGERQTRAGDIAVVVRRNADALGVLHALHAAGVPAVMSTAQNVFDTAAALDWITLLSALTDADPRMVATASLTPVVGWSADTLGSAGDHELDELQDRFASWAQVLHERGVAALLQVLADDGMRERVLSRPEGERYMTDLRHVAEILHATARSDRLAPAGLLHWLRGRVGARDASEDAERRLETDAAAVQVTTIHAAKGLQFPLVMVPFLFERHIEDAARTLRFHEGDQRCLHVGGRGSPGYSEASTAAAQEEAGEFLRLAYVALTRARSHLTVWWAPSRPSATGPLSRLLLADRLPDGTIEASAPARSDQAVQERFDELAAASDGSLVHEVLATSSDPVTWTPPAVADQELVTATVTRRLETSWRRLSYTALTAQAAPTHAGVGDEPEHTGLTDEPDETRAHPVISELTGLDGQVAPMAGLPSGTAFGTLVHSVLESVDTTATDLLAEVKARCEQTGLTRALRVEPGALALALMPALTTPLGPVAGGLSLADIAPTDRLAELEFELPLAGGDSRRPDRSAATLAALADLIDQHLAADDAFAGYGAHVRASLPRPAVHAHLAGYLTGSIDAVLRVRDPDGTPRYLVVDYKTNRLAPPDKPLTLGHYRPEAMVTAMFEHHYPLQLLLYSVALHRYLRWRHPGYDPDIHLGGAVYLFVRGMPGPPATPSDADDRAVVAPSGVLAWRPPTALVLALSDLLAGAAA